MTNKTTRKRDKNQSTKELMDIESISEDSLCTRHGDLVFFIISPTNISVLPGESVSARITALLNVIKGQADVEMLAMNAAESFGGNKSYYQARSEAEEIPAIRKLLEEDGKHLDRIQILIASAREFYIVLRRRKEKGTEDRQYLTQIEKQIKDNGFVTRRAAEQDIKRMLGVYYEQNVTTERYESVDGERWVLLDV